jgi:predicted dehydrogenase
VVRLLVASGVQVVGLDMVEARCRAAEKAGALKCAAPDDQGVREVEQVLLDRTGGLGADHVLLAAGGASNGPVEVAARLARDRARVVDIGKTRLDLPWNAYYDKELDVRFSRSYGPGRYDPTYELDGIDYPAGYVRWTERRNLACFLDLVADGSVDVTTLIDGVHPIEEAEDVYRRLGDGSLRGIGFLLSYPEVDLSAPLERTLRTPSAVPAAARSGQRRSSGNVRIGFIGAGNYATSMLLPHLRSDAGAKLVSVATTRALSGINAQRKFGFSTVTTNVDSVLDDDTLDAVFIVTRHQSHAGLVCRALERGLSVFVEKPLALTAEQVAAIEDTVDRTGNTRIMVGFNRRFAPTFTDLRDRFGHPASPLSARYLVNAGRLDAGSWYLDEEREGSRFTGEGGHFIDTVSALVESSPVEVYAMGAGGDVHATLRFANGSVGSISYLTDGNQRFPKETLDVTGDGRNGRLDNFSRVTVWSAKGKSGHRVLSGQDKGQQAQLKHFVEAVRTGAEMPIQLDSLLATTRATLAVAESLALQRPVSV